jgi:hypothetical protein
MAGLVQACPGHDGFTRIAHFIGCFLRGSLKRRKQRRSPSRPRVGMDRPQIRAPFAQVSVALATTHNKRAADCSAALRHFERMAYFRLVIAVRSAESLTMPAAPHQFEPVPSGLMGVTLVVPEALYALVKALQLPFDRSVSE